jgi:hypothetical protein
LLWVETSDMTRLSCFMSYDARRYLIADVINLVFGIISLFVLGLLSLVDWVISFHLTIALITYD